MLLVFSQPWRNRSSKSLGKGPSLKKKVEPWVLLSLFNHVPGICVLHVGVAEVLVVVQGSQAVSPKQFVRREVEEIHQADHRNFCCDSTV